MSCVRKKELTADDWRLVQLLVDGWALQDIAKDRNVNYDALKNRLSRMFDVAGVWTRVELVAKGFRSGKLQ